MDEYEKFQLNYSKGVTIVVSDISHRPKKMGCPVQLSSTAGCVKIPYESLQNILCDLLPFMSELDSVGMSVDGCLFVLPSIGVEIWQYLLSVLDLQTVSCRHWCPDCKLG